MSASSKNASADSGDMVIDVTPISLLQDVQDHGRVWSDLAAQYGVTNPDPPWKITLEATCDLLAGDSAVKAYGDIVPGSCALPSLERRAEEDEMSEDGSVDIEGESEDELEEEEGEGEGEGEGAEDDAMEVDEAEKPADAAASKPVSVAS